MKKFVKDIEQNGRCGSVGVGSNTQYYLSEGMEEREVEQAYTGEWYLEGYAPEEPIEHKNEQIRQQRQSRFAMESDPLYLDYVEAQARGDETVDDKKQLWLDKKDEIRNDLPYIEE